jgi:hypothetical protein
LFEAADFKWLSVQVRCKMWYQKMKMKLIVLGIIVTLILIITSQFSRAYAMSDLGCWKWLGIAASRIM